MAIITASFMLGAHGEFKKELSFPKTHKVGDVSLIQNGHAIRVVKRYGLDFKVYEASLYTKTASKSEEEIYKSTDPKFLKMEFVRKVDREDIIKGWKKAYKDNCIKECKVKASKSAFSKFNKTMEDMKKGGTILITIMPDKVIVKVDGRVRKNSKIIEDPNFPTNLLAIFIGKNVSDKRLKKGLLGL